jgi:hypothetical protein
MWLPAVLIGTSISLFAQVAPTKVGIIHIQTAIIGTKDGQVASDGGKGMKNSPFTFALLEHLADPDDINIVLRRVREKVKRATGGKQVPWEYGSLTGDALILSAIKQVESKK